ncbi:MAG: outer membrane beta-barrel protein [bacterium]|nr:outer membrane beta-barrel protein [bacterium]
MKKPLIYAAVLCGCFMSAPLLAASDYQPGFRIGNFKVDPVVSAGIAWESNIGNTSRNEESGFLWRVQAAASLAPAVLEDRRTFLTANVFYNMERGFDSKDGADSDSYGISAVFRRELAKQWNLTINGGYTRSEDDNFWYGSNDAFGNPTTPDIYTDKSENYNFNAAVGYRGPKWTFGFGAGWHRSRHLDGNKTSNDSYTASVRAGHVLPAISPSCYLTTSLSAIYDDPDRGDTSVSYTLLAGLSGDFSDKTSYSAMVGISFYDYSGLVDDTSVNPAYNFSIARKISRRVSLALTASSRYEAEDSGQANLYYVWSHHLTAALNLTIDDKTDARLSASGIYEDHVGSQGHADYDRTYVQLQASLHRQFYRALYGFVSVSWRRDDNNSVEKDDYRAEVGLSWRF